MSDIWVDIQTIDGTIIFNADAIIISPRGNKGMRLCDESNNFILDQSGNRIEVG